ncbi:MAG: cobyric acid synthase [Pseudomonadota bacterium]
MTATLMIQGTGSDVGKSLIVAGLCRHFARKGLKVRPFKPQNMSNNAAATDDGGEIGRAQTLQARAAGVATSVHMNPVLLKPQSETGAQVVVAGKVMTSVGARDYGRVKKDLLAPVLHSFGEVSRGADLVLVEGAGSPAEINLRLNDIANMGFARAAGVPVVLVADIHRGGVIANLVGTAAVLEPADRAMVSGFIVNKFRGDVSLFDDGVKAIEARTNWRGLGVVPWFAEAGALPAEDTLGLQTSSQPGGLKVVVPRIPHIANFDDLDPLRLEAGVSVEIAPLDTALAADADIVILPGSKSTCADLAALKSAGWDTDLRAFVRRGGTLIGLCGGYQMLGRTVADPNGIEGPAGTMEGLGLLNVETVLTAPKITKKVVGDAKPILGVSTPVEGYRIHMGRTEGADAARPVVLLGEGPDGAVSRAGNVFGTYVHGIFGSDALRAAILSRLGHASQLAYEAHVEATLDCLADHLAACLDMDALHKIAKAAARAA